MPRREFPLVSGQYYHVYNRGLSYRGFVGLRLPAFVEPETVLSQLSPTGASRRAREQACRLFVEKGGEVDPSIHALIFEEAAIEAPEP